MADVFFIANLVLGVLCVLILWRGRRLRTKVVFHLGALALAIGLYTAMALTSETPEDRIPMKYIVQMIFGIVVHAPLLVFLVVTYVGALFRIDTGQRPPIPLMLKEAEDNIDFGRLTEAARTLKHVLAHDPDDPQAHKLMADLRLARGQYDKAIGSLRLAMPHAEDDSQFARFVFQVAEIYTENLGDFKAAARELDLVRSRMPDTPEAQKAHKLIVQLMSKDAEGS